MPDPISLSKGALLDLERLVREYREAKDDYMACRIKPRASSEERKGQRATKQRLMRRIEAVQGAIVAWSLVNVPDRREP